MCVCTSGMRCAVSYLCAICVLCVCCNVCAPHLCHHAKEEPRAKHLDQHIITARHSTANQSAAQERTGQDNLAQDTKGQDSTAQHSTKTIKNTDKLKAWGTHRDRAKKQYPTLSKQCTVQRECAQLTAKYSTQHTAHRTQHMHSAYTEQYSTVRD